MAIPRPRRNHRQGIIADIDAPDRDEGIAAVAIFAGAEARAGRKTKRSKRDHNQLSMRHHLVPPQPIACRTQAASAASGFIVR